MKYRSAARWSSLLLSLVCTLLINTQAFAQAASAITLHLMAKGSGVPVSRVEVKINGTRGSSSGKDGNVKIDVPAGAGKVELYRAGYETMSYEFAELRGKATMDVYLFPATPADNEVLVRGAKRPEASRKTVSVEEAAKVAPGGDPAQIPKLLPGVQASTFSPEIVVRGSGPNDSAYWIDDWRVPFIFHRIDNISVIPDQLLSDVEFSTGGFGAQYGEATGGVVTLRTKSEVPERAKTEVRINLPFYSSIYHEEPINDGKDLMAVSARRSYLEAFLPFILKGNDGLTVSPYFGDEHGYYYHPTEDGHVKVMLMGAYDGLHAVANLSESDNEDGRGQLDFLDQYSMLGAEWKKNLNKEWSISTTPQVSNSYTRANFLGDSLKININDLRLQTEATRKFSGKDRMYLGVDAEYAYAKVYALFPKVDRSDPFADAEEAPKVSTTISSGYNAESGWVAGDKQFGDLLLTPGVRVFYNSQIKRNGADPRLNVRYQLTESNALKGAVGQYSETPQFQDTDKVFGNPNLDFIHSYHYIMGVETDWSHLWTTDFQGFYKETHNLVRSDPVKTKNNDGSLISYGFEAFVRRNLTERTFGWLAYTYSKTRERDNNSQAFRESQYDQTHVLNLVGDYKLTALWDLGGRLLYHTGDTFTPVDYSVYNTNLDKYEARTNPTTKLYSDRQPNYHELDLFAMRDSLYDTWKLTWRFGVEYLWFERQVQGVQYNYDYTKKEYFKGVPPIPYLELRGVI